MGIVNDDKMKYIQSGPSMFPKRTSLFGMPAAVLLDVVKENHKYGLIRLMVKSKSQSLCNVGVYRWHWLCHFVSGQSGCCFFFKEIWAITMGLWAPMLCHIIWNSFPSVTRVTSWDDGFRQWPQEWIQETGIFISTDRDSHVWNLLFCKALVRKKPESFHKFHIRALHWVIGSTRNGNPWSSWGVTWHDDLVIMFGVQDEKSTFFFFFVSLSLCLYMFVSLCIPS